MVEAEDDRLTFSDEDFERRYSSENAASASASRPSRPAAQPESPLAARMGRSRNRFMRTLLRRRLLQSATG